MFGAILENKLSELSKEVIDYSNLNLQKKMWKTVT
jgi:hypothetical protein